MPAIASHQFSLASYLSSGAAPLTLHRARLGSYSRHALEGKCSLKRRNRKRTKRRRRMRRRSTGREETLRFYRTSCSIWSLIKPLSSQPIPNFNLQVWVVVAVVFRRWQWFFKLADGGSRCVC